MSEEREVLGIGVVGALSGNREKAVALAWAALEPIASVRLDEEGGRNGDGALVITFRSGRAVQFTDAYRSCCESRYMRTDDDLTIHAGALLLGAEVLRGEAKETDYEETNEVAFLHVRTSAGVICVNTHNDHNGYYGGISIEVEEVGG